MLTMYSSWYRHSFFLEFTISFSSKPLPRKDSWQWLLLRSLRQAARAFAELKAEGNIPENGELRQVKYLNNLIEQDHRFIKRLTKPGMGFFSFETAWRTLQGFEVMNMLRKGQVQGVKKGDVSALAGLVATLFGVAA